MGKDSKVKHRYIAAIVLIAAAFTIAAPASAQAAERAKPCPLEFMVGGCGQAPSGGGSAPLVTL